MIEGTSSPIVVVGAGVIGLCTALHLKAATHRDVIVLEAGNIGDGTTPAGAGFVAPWATVLPHLGAPGLALIDYSLAYYADIAASGADIRYRNNGNVVFFNNQHSQDAALAAIRSHAELPADTRVVTPNEIATMTDGALDPTKIAGGIHMPRGMQFETGLMLEHLTKSAIDAGVDIRTHTVVDSIHTAGGQLTGLSLDVSGEQGTVTNSSIDTDCAVLAVGAWLNELLAGVNWKLPLLPFMATRFVTEDLGLSPNMPTMQGKDFPLWIRESEGGFTWGTTPGAAPAHRLATPWTSHQPAQRTFEHLIQAMDADAARVAEVFPALRDAKVIRTIQGMPVYTVDRQFFAGPVPTCGGLWAVGGDNESGVSHAPGLGRLMADLVTDSNAPLCDSAMYRLDRYPLDAFPDAEAVGQKFLQDGEGFIAEAMRTPSDES